MKPFILLLFLIASIAFAQTMTVKTQGKFFGCQSKEYYLELGQYVTQKDLEAFNTGLGRGLLSGQCVMFKAGEKVFVMNTQYSGILLQVRRKGLVTKYWTLSNGFKK